MVLSIQELVPLYYDNSGVIALAKEQMSHQKSKHIEQQYHIICNYVYDKKYIVVLKVASANNVADPLTKVLNQQKLETHLEKMGLRYMSDWL